MAPKKGGLHKGLGALGLNSSYAHEFEKKDGVKELNLTEIHPNPNQPRKNFAEDDMATLIESIKLYGVFQPILVRKEGDGYQIVAGERRWRAAKEAGLETIPVLVKDYSTEEVTEIALVENLQRQNLDPIEEAYAYQRLITTFKQTQEVIATRLGRSRSHIANMIRLLQLPELIRNELSSGEITVGQARPLLSLSKEALQIEALGIIKEKELNARQVEQLVKTWGQNKAKKKTSKGDSAEIRALVDRLRLSVGSPVSIHVKNAQKVQGTIEITFRNEMELERLMEYLEAER